jgi:putative transcriptional regulator
MGDDNEYTDDTSGFLTGHLLIATPAIQESCFARSVIYLCAHNEAGAMGVIINYPVQDLNLKEIFQQLDISADKQMRDLPIHFGGPVESNRGFIVHSAEDCQTEEALIRKNGVAVTSSINVLQALAVGKGPTKGMLVLGYAGWSAGQLEAEIESGSWIAVPASKHLVLDTDNETKWNVAISTLGIDMGHFSSDVGHA